MRPFYFGQSDSPLLGVLHPPEEAAYGRGAAVLCPPFGPEYVRAHRALRELANRLATTGLYVLRFDYYGTGDSAGEHDEGTVARWLDDIGLAFEEAKESCEGGPVSIVGLRLGATLAALWACGRSDVHSLVLWDPIVSGRQYLLELLRRHDAFFAVRPRPIGYRQPSPPTEVLGTPLTAPLRTALEEVDLLALPRRPAPLVSVIAGDADPSLVDLCERLRRSGATIEYQRRTGTKLWLTRDEFEQALVPHETILEITSWLSR